MTKPTAIMEELSALGAKNVFIIAEDPQSLALFTELGSARLNELIFRRGLCGSVQAGPEERSKALKGTKSKSGGMYVRH